MTRRVIPLLLATWLVLGTPAAGTPTWGAPVQISTGDRALGPDLAMNSAGEAIVVWDHELGSDCPTSPASLSCIHIVEAATRARGSTAWQAPIEISRPGIGSAPLAAIDPNGNAAILWVHDIGDDRVLQATYRRGPSGSFPEPNDLSASVRRIGEHYVALDAAGNAVAVWAERSVGVREEAMVAVRSAQTGGWGSPARLTGPAWGVASGPVVHVFPSGAAIVAWIESNGVVKASLGDITSGRWDSPVALTGSAGPPKLGVRMAADDAGDIVVVWASGEPAGPTTAQGVFRSRDGSWRGLEEIGPMKDGAAAELEVAIDAAGRAVALSVAPTGISAAARGSSGTWDRSAVSASNAVVAQPRIAMDNRGNAVALWVAGNERRLGVALRPAASGAWNRSGELSRVAVSHPQVAMHGADGVAVWERNDAQRVVLESADLAGRGPVLESVIAPKRVVAGASARFSVELVPWASPLAGKPLWRFGDGSSAEGAVVVHTYARRGRFELSVSQKDAAGDVSSAASTITVRAATVRNERRPFVKGKPRVGSTLTCFHGAWSGSPPIRFRYGWKRNGQTIPRATQSHYRLVLRDAGSRIVCQVAATNPAGRARARSSIVRVER